MVIGEMSKCSFKSPCGKLVGVVHGDDILLSGPRSLVDAVRNSLRKRCEIREQMLGAGPKDASEIIMLNRRVQWTEAGIRTSQDPVTPPTTTFSSTLGHLTLHLLSCPPRVATSCAVSPPRSEHWKTTRESVQAAIKRADTSGGAAEHAMHLSTPPPSPPPVSTPAHTRSRSPAPVPKKARRSIASQPQDPGVTDGVVSGLAVKSCPTAAPRRSRLSRSPAMSSSPDLASGPSRRGVCCPCRVSAISSICSSSAPSGFWRRRQRGATLTSLDPSLAASLATPRQVREISR